MKNIVNDWVPEVRSFVDRLVAAGCQVLAADNGEDTLSLEQAGGDLGKIVDCLIACDESWLMVKTPGGTARFWLVLGNSPGELVADYSYPVADEAFVDSLTGAHFDEWEGKQQPTKEI